MLPKARFKAFIIVHALASRKRREFGEQLTIARIRIVSECLAREPTVTDRYSEENLPPVDVCDFHLFSITNIATALRCSVV